MRRQREHREFLIAAVLTVPLMAEMVRIFFGRGICCQVGCKHCCTAGSAGAVSGVDAISIAAPGAHYAAVPPTWTVLVTLGINVAYLFNLFTLLITSHGHLYIVCF
ncbi:MAG: hypothetical protein ACR5LD_06000 [Symbiopectobacterium sp.]